LIAIPIIGLSALATVTTSNIPTPAETVRDNLGNNQAKLTVVSTPNSSLKQDPLNPEDWNISGSGQVDSQGAPTTPHGLPSAYLPTGTTILTLRDVAVVARTATGTGSMSALQGSAWNSSFRGRFAVLSGRTPRSPNEIMATPAALVRLGKAVGQSVTISEPRHETLTIVGTMRDLTEPDSTERIFARAGALDGVSAAKDLLDTSFYLPNHAVSWAEVERLNQDGITVLSRSVVLNPPPIPGAWSEVENPYADFQTVLVALPVVAFSLFEVALLAGAAFMVGTKQQERSLATLSSVGGDRRMLSRVVSSAGVVLGLAGGILGSLLGAVVAWIYMQSTSNGSISAFPGFHVNPFVAGGIVAFAVLAGWIAALVPARRASRIDVVASLRGAARPLPPSRRAPLVGVIVALVGIAVTVAGTALVVTGDAASNHALSVAQFGIAGVVAGPILLQIAALIIAPAILRAVARVLTRAGTAARLASRDIARNASRSVPAVGAIMSTIFVASFVMTYTAAAQAEQTADYVYRTAPGLVSTQFYQFAPSKGQSAQLASALKSTLHATAISVLDSARTPGSNPGTKEHFAVPELNGAARCTQLPSGPVAVKPGSLSVTSLDCQGPEYLIDPESSPHIWIASPAAISRAIGTPLNATSRAALAAGKAVAFYPQYLHAGKVIINWWTAHQLGQFEDPGGSGHPARSASVPAVLQTPPHAVNFDLVMTPATAHALGVQYSESQIIAKAASAPTDSQLDALDATSQAIGAGPRAYFFYEGGPQSFASTAQWAILALSALIALGAAAIAIGLARAEGRRDERVLGSLGAPPLLRRSFSFWSAVVITGVGSIGGVILGTVPALAVSQSLVQEGGRAAVPYSPPWLILAIAAIGLPLLLAIGSWLTAGRSRVQYNVRAPIE
jgi:hypothetical protein